jgi:hypothetical protein
MKLLRLTLSVLILCTGVLCAGSGASAPDHSLWDGILKKYVSPAARVDYVRLKQTGVQDLDRYVAMIGGKWPASMSSNARRAAFINAYNALMIRWMVIHYPIESVWRTKKPFTNPRHLVDGRKMSLDDVEKWLRDTGDPRVHAVLVCASIGCPPLRREAYVEARLDAQMDDSTRVWLADPNRNQFLPERRTAEVSKIFSWYRGDFEKNGGSVTSFIAKYAPAKYTYLKSPGVTLRFKPYHWGINDTSGLGNNYSQAKYLLDSARNK